MIARCSLLAQALCLSLCALCGHAAAQETQATTPAKGEMATLDKVTVAATRYNATDMQMAATNTVNVLSADDLKTTAVHNVAEALGLMPGVNVINTGQSYFGGIDGAARGEGMFSSVRGLNAEYNVNLINGINVAQGMPYSRGVQLSLLPPSGLQTIALSKTSTADMDGDAIGGTIDYRTPSAFDSTDRQGGSVTLSGRLESRARDYGDSGLGSGAAGDWHARFGDAGQFGVAVSAYYDERHFVNSEVAAASAARNDGAWKFGRADASGKLAAGADPQDVLQSTGMNIGYSQGDTRRYGGNAAFDWRVDPSLHLYARMTYAFAKTEQNTGYAQFVPANVSFTQIGTSGVYQPQINRVAVRYWYETNPEKADLATVQFGADKQLGHWTFSPNIFYGTGNNDRPDHVEISARNDQYSSTNFAYGANRFISYDGNGFPTPLLTPAMQAQASDVESLYARRTGQISKQYSGQDKGGGKFDVAYDFDAGLLSRIAFGVKYVDSSRNFTDRDWTNAKYTDRTLLRDTGLIAQRYDSVYPGQYAFPTVRLSNAALNDLIARTLTPASFDSCGKLAINNLNCNTMRATEAVSAAYAMATLRSGNWEILPGVRFEHTAITNTFWAQRPPSMVPSRSVRSPTITAATTSLCRACSSITGPMAMAPCIAVRCGPVTHARHSCSWAAAAPPIFPATARPPSPKATRISNRSSRSMWMCRANGRTTAAATPCWPVITSASPITSTRAARMLPIPAKALPPAPVSCVRRTAATAACWAWKRLCGRPFRACPHRWMASA